uniref:Protein transport protein Sec31A n=1 Tax=Lepisosteus oculatus TaxID=7918 RepID=W5MXJ2_LEPOC
MKLKEIDRTAIQAWSPGQHHPIYLAAGTSAQQLDATFSTTASLEIFELDLADTTLDMKSCGAFSSSHRYHKLVWGPHGMDSQGLPSGVLIAGGENGNVILYDPAKIIAGDEDVVIAQNDKHTGPVRALDINPFQTNLVVSGGNESEIYIWDLNSFGSPMTPGPKSQPLEDVGSVAWNRQVQHILASASPSGRTSVWDLRKNEPIIKVSDHSNRMHCSGLAWNPEVATQLVLASEDDRMPVIQMWDLRFATSPLKVLENHTRGVLAIAWSLADPELLLSCGKDNRILCWNPNTAEVLYELPTSTQWCFDIQWCPRNPAVLSAAAFDGHVSVYSIMGGNVESQSRKQADQLSSSFGNLDPFGTGQALPPLQLPQHTPQQSTVMPLKKPPKWIRRPVGASFAFGGKLVMFENIKAAAQQQQQQPPVPHCVYVSQVVTETMFLKRSNELQSAMTAGSFVDFCQSKVESSQNEFERNVWSFLKANFESNPRGKYLDLLGYKKEDLAQKITGVLQKEETSSSEPEPTDSISGDSPAAEQLPLEERKEEDGESDVLKERPTAAKEIFNLSVSEDLDGLITQALLTGDFEGAVDLCLHDNRMADAIILAIAGGQELLAKTQKKYFDKTQSKITRLITAVVMKDWKEIVEACDLQNWREALAAVLTYAGPEEFASLCDLLGTRLEGDGDLELQAQACLCYICAGNVEKLVACWTKAQDGNSPLSLQDLVEKVVVLQRAVEATRSASSTPVGALLAEKMSQYASLLAAQGSLATAIAYLPSSTDQAAVVQLRDRLYRAQGAHTGAPAALGFPSTKYIKPNTLLCFVASHQIPSVRFPVCFPSQAEPPPPGFVMQSMANPSIPSSAAPGYMYPQTNTQQGYPQTYPQAQEYSPGVGGPTIYQPHQHTPPPPPSSSSSAPYPTRYMHPAPSHPLPPACAGTPFPGQSQGSSGGPLPPASTFSPPPPPLSSGASFQHGGPGAPASSYAPPPPAGTTGTLPAPASRPPHRNGSSLGVLVFLSPPLFLKPSGKKAFPKKLVHPVKLTFFLMNLKMEKLNLLFAEGGGNDPDTSCYPEGELEGGILVKSSLQFILIYFDLLRISRLGDKITNQMDIILKVLPYFVACRVLTPTFLMWISLYEGTLYGCKKLPLQQTKRKLDDANKRLESLYDKLRDQTLSPAIIGGLHNIARSIESRCYMDGLNIHTHIVSNSNFSETSAFMPVLKVILTQANKLGV